MGNISPNNKIKKVTTITSIINFTWVEKPLKNILLKDANKRTIAMFMKLLATNIVANNRLGLDSNLATNFLFVKDFLSAFNWDCVNEKKETSEPEIKAEKSNNTINDSMLINELVLKKKIEILEYNTISFEVKN